jgi:hypothetical protein
MGVTVNACVGALEDFVIGANVSASIDSNTNEINNAFFIFLQSPFWHLSL